MNKIKLIDRAGRNGATALSTEFFCLELRSPVLKKRLKTISELAGFDYLKFYKKYSVSQGYLRLNRNIKRKYVNEMELAARQNNMRFYVSDAHFKERCDNGSCCGLSPDWNYSRGQFCEALMIAKKHGKVHFSDIAGEMDFLRDFRWLKARGFNTGNAEKETQFIYHSMFDFMRFLWNNPKEGQSPYRLFEGILVPVGLDSEKDLVYEYDQKKS